jgi:hypothetical protein
MVGALRGRAIPLLGGVVSLREQGGRGGCAPGMAHISYPQVNAIAEPCCIVGTDCNLSGMLHEGGAHLTVLGQYGGAIPLLGGVDFLPAQGKKDGVVVRPVCRIVPHPHLMEMANM